LLKTSVVPELMRLHTCQTTAKENLGPEIRIIKMAAFETFCVARKKKNQQFLVSVFFPKKGKKCDEAHVYGKIRLLNEVAAADLCMHL
jgi:hypothetical protein